MRVLLGCGGTGGHIYPAIAIADRLREASAHCLFVGAQGGMEEDIVPAAGYPIELISIRGFQRKWLLQNLQLPWLVCKSLYQVRKIIRSFNPDIVIGTGGYASFPTLLLACILGIPTLLHEQNSRPGLVNRFLARFVSKICTGYPDVPFPCKKEKIVVTGNPIHRSAHLPPCTHAEALRYFNLPVTQPCLLVVGGSGGSNKLNAIVLEGLHALQRANVSLLWITGQRYYKAIQAHLTHHSTTAIACYPFLDQMGMAYQAADVVIARAGALSIAELCVAQKPTILVPSPNVVGNHQHKNALPLAKQLAVISLEEQNCTTLLLPYAIQLLQDSAQKKSLVDQMYPFTMLHKEALTQITEEILRLPR